MTNRINLGNKGIDLEGAKEFRITNKKIEVEYESGAVMIVGLEYEPFISNHFSRKPFIRLRYAVFAFLAGAVSWYLLGDNITYFVMANL